MHRASRIILACLIAPLATIPVAFAVAGVTALTNHRIDADSAVSGAMLASFGAVVIAYAVTIILGVPIYLFSSRQGPPVTLNVAMTGAAIGSILGIFFQDPTMFWFAAASGALVAYVFCKVAATEEVAV